MPGWRGKGKKGTDGGAGREILGKTPFKAYREIRGDRWVQEKSVWSGWLHRGISIEKKVFLRHSKKQKLRNKRW